MVQRVIAILWPSFLTSGVATILFFTAFDPVHLLAGTAAAELSRTGAYTIGFFLFWALTTLTSALTCYFQRPCVNENLKNRPHSGRKPDEDGDDSLHGAV